MNAQMHPLRPPAPANLDSNDALIDSGRRVLDIETRALHAMRPCIDAHFAAACRLILAARGRVVAIGMGKSGHIARKVAATMSSTGTMRISVPTPTCKKRRGASVDGGGASNARRRCST